MRKAEDIGEAAMKAIQADLAADPNLGVHIVVYRRIGNGKLDTCIAGKSDLTTTNTVFQRDMALRLLGLNVKNQN